MTTEAGIKHDTGKAPWDLAPWDAFLAIVKVLAFGAAKYAPRNWEKGIAYSRVYAAALRHLTDWWAQNDKGKGPGKDADTGFSDLWHAGCCVCFLIAYELRGVPNLDDRPVLTLADTAEIMAAARVVTVEAEPERRTIKLCDSCESGIKHAQRAGFSMFELCGNCATAERSFVALDQPLTPAKSGA